MPGVTVPQLMAALQAQVNTDAGPIWGFACQLTIGFSTLPGQWGLILLDDSDQADALGYHELTRHGMPIAKVFVRTSLDDNSSPTVTASHELLEMLGDPMIDLTVPGPDGNKWAKENCDAVEATSYKINGVDVSNFQTPAWFSSAKPSTQFKNPYDFLGLCNEPFELLHGGYQSIELPRGGWIQQFGSLHAASAFRSKAKWRPQVRESGIKLRSTR
jgi:hypothetical protein